MKVGGTSRKGNRRVWSRVEEEALLIILEDVVTCRHHCDIGAFKSETIIMIEKKLTDICPNSNLKANPYIETKLKIWKKKK